MTEAAGAFPDHAADREDTGMTRPGRLMSNTLAKELYGGKDLGEACLNCRFFDESRGTELAVCRRHKIRTNIAASCREYSEKTGTEP